MLLNHPATDINVLDDSGLGVLGLAVRSRLKPGQQQHGVPRKDRLAWNVIALISHR